MVEAVGFRRRAVRIDLHGKDLFVRHADDRGPGRRIVPVMPDENPVVLVVEPLQRRLEHLRNHRCFIPGRDENRHETGVFIEDVMARVGRPVASMDRPRPPEAPCEIDDVDAQIVEAEQQEADAREKRELGRNARENLRGIHGSDRKGS